MDWTSERNGPHTSTRDWLERKGHRFDPPHAVAATALPDELWRLIDALAEDARIFLEGTDHLTDAELYAKLWEKVLPTELQDADRAPSCATHWDFSGSRPYEEDPFPGLEDLEAELEEEAPEEPPLKRVCRRDEQLPRR